MATEYRISDVSSTDMFAAYRCEANRAESERMMETAKRQRRIALHIQNAVEHMVTICPDGFRVKTDVVFSLVPDVNPVKNRE